jgi:hypothetical protein
MDLCTNAGVVSEAMKVVTRKEEQINTLQKQDEKTEKTEQMATAEETTTNGVF